jgi:very-short-patch-repair endonuclease
LDKKHKTPVDPILLSRARDMRRDPAPAEQKLWRLLRDRQLNGLKFRRQVPLGSFVADFYCHEADLVIELDGDSHVERVASDRLQTQILNRERHRVIRFLNTDVFENLDGVLEAILEEAERSSIRTCPQPRPLPGGEGVI